MHPKDAGRRPNRRKIARETAARLELEATALLCPSEAAPGGLDYPCEQIPVPDWDRLRKQQAAPRTDLDRDRQRAWCAANPDRLLVYYATARAKRAAERKAKSEPHPAN